MNPTQLANAKMNPSGSPTSRTSVSAATPADREGDGEQVAAGPGAGRRQDHHAEEFDRTDGR